ncbi:alpha/beta fold hydrolase [Sphaerisporangium sp. B11E5]|uniref:alpha/beta fold hydrolase n=1 Tax=Sphaerisporangium sp. B11E5 TaxID=3153563 RepID=UPI00325E26D9
MGDSREAYRFVAPALVAAGYRVAAVDMGGGESSVGWAFYTRTDVADDLIALVNHLGGPAVLVGHSLAGGAATIARRRPRRWSPRWSSWRRSPASSRSRSATCG